MPAQPACFRPASSMRTTAPSLIEGEQARADVDGRDFLDFTVVAERQLAGAAADIDIQHDAADFGGMRHGARTMCGHRRFEAVAGAYRDELSGFLREQLARSRARCAAGRRRR